MRTFLQLLIIIPIFALAGIIATALELHPAIATQIGVMVGVLVYVTIVQSKP